VSLLGGGVLRGVSLRGILSGTRQDDQEILVSY